MNSDNLASYIAIKAFKTLTMGKMYLQIDYGKVLNGRMWYPAYRVLIMNTTTRKAAYTIIDKPAAGPWHIFPDNINGGRKYMYQLIAKVIKKYRTSMS